MRLANFKCTPKAIRLQAGRPAVLRLVNTAGGSHDFTAPEFFAAAHIKADHRGFIRNGSVEIPSGQAREIALLPKAGRYKVKCTHTMHKMLGMSGEILVR
ncbi:MAG: copper-binding protein [Sphingosinicella sp.]|nr:copper-binding protein [Sphingosinicella sp.]